MPSPCWRPKHPIADPTRIPGAGRKTGAGTWECRRPIFLKCYKVLDGKAVDKIVSLGDRFGTPRLETTERRLLCVPSTKTVISEK